MLVPVLRDVADAGLVALMDAAFGDILAAQGNPALAGLFQTGQAVDQLGLSVAVDTGDADNLTGTNLEGYLLHRVVFMQPGGDGQALHIQNHLTGVGRPLFHL